MLEAWDTMHLKKADSDVSGLAGTGIPSCFISAKARGILRGDEANGVFEVGVISVVLLYSYTKHSYTGTYVFLPPESVRHPGSEVLRF